MGNEVFVIAHTERGTRLAEDLTKRVEAILRAPQRFFAAPGDRRGFIEPVGVEVQKLFRNAKILILIMELETAIRILAPVITGQNGGPAVVVIDEMGRFVVDLLSGRDEATNQLVTDLADNIGAQAVITANGAKPAAPLLDEVARQNQMNLESAELIPKFTEAMLNNENIVVWDRWGLNLSWPEPVRVETGKNLQFFDCEKLLLVIGYQNVPAIVPVKMQVLALRPLCLTVGIGCSGEVSNLKVIGAIRRYFREQNWSVKSIRQLVSGENCANQAAVSAAGRDLGVSVIFLTVSQMLKQSAANKTLQHGAELDLGMTAENAAVIGSKRGKLIGLRRVIDQISIAVAFGQEGKI
jgi:cobalt-precorrin 5A hydrolase